MTENSIQNEFQAQPFCDLSTIQNNKDEINLLEYVYALLKNKWWIIAAVVLGSLLGYCLAILKGPVYIAEAVIAAKQNDNMSTSSLSGLGALGGLVASQLNIPSNPGLDKIQLIINSRKFNSDLIEKYNLLPLIYKDKWPKVYQNYYDTVKCNWKPGFHKPKMLIMGGYLRDNYLRKEVKDNTLVLKFISADSVTASVLISKYLLFLNYHIQTSVQNEAKDNVSYLEGQLIAQSDPLLREKIQTMIANEIEKSMLVSKIAFKVIDPEIIYEENKIKTLYPIMFSALFLCVSVLVILCNQAFKSSIKSKEDEILLGKIKEQLGVKKKSKCESKQV